MQCANEGEEAWKGRHGSRRREMQAVPAAQGAWETHGLLELKNMYV